MAVAHIAFSEVKQRTFGCVYHYKTPSPSSSKPLPLRLLPFTIDHLTIDQIHFAFKPFAYSYQALSTLQSFHFHFTFTENMGVMKYISRWFRMRKIAARVDRKRYAKMRNGTYDFTLQGTPKSSASKDIVAPPVRKLEIASNSPSPPSSEESNLFPGFPYTDENDNDNDGNSCILDAAAIDQDIEEHVDSQFPSPASTVHSQELEDCLREMPPLKAYRFLGLYDPEPSRVYLPPVVADRPPSLESLPPLSPLALSFEEDDLINSAQSGQPEETSDQPTGSSIRLRITSTVSVEITTETEANSDSLPDGTTDISSFAFADSGPAIVVSPATESDTESCRLSGPVSSEGETAQEGLNPDVAHLFY